MLFGAYHQTKRPPSTRTTERQGAPQLPPERTRHHDAKQGNTLTPTRQRRKLLDDPEQLFKKSPADFARP